MKRKKIDLRSVCTDLGPGEMLITLPILNGFPDSRTNRLMTLQMFFWYYS